MKILQSMKKIINSHFIFCVVPNLHVHVPCKKNIYSCMWIKNATQWILTWSWGSVPFGSGWGTPGVRWGWSPYWWWWTSHHLKSLKMNVTVQKIAQKINKYIPWAPEVWILLYPPPFFWISLVGIFSSKCMNISIKYKWIKIKFTHFREIIITITTNQKKGQVRGMIVHCSIKT